MPRVEDVKLESFKIQFQLGSKERLDFTQHIVSYTCRQVHIKVHMQVHMQVHKQVHMQVHKKVHMQVHKQVHVQTGNFLCFHKVGRTLKLQVDAYTLGSTNLQRLNFIVVMTIRLFNRISILTLIDSFSSILYGQQFSICKFCG